MFAHTSPSQLQIFSNLETNLKFSICSSEYLIFQKIIKLDYQFPSGFHPDAKDLVEKLLRTDHLERLGATDTEPYSSVQSHPFFQDIPWDTLHTREAPFPTILPSLPSATPGGGGPPLRSQVIQLNLSHFIQSLLDLIPDGLLCVDFRFSRAWIQSEDYGRTSFEGRRWGFPESCLEWRHWRHESNWFRRRWWRGGVRMPFQSACWPNTTSAARGWREKRKGWKDSIPDSEFDSSEWGREAGAPGGTSQD